MPTEYQQPVGGMWTHKDRRNREFFSIQIQMGDLLYSFNAFVNNFKENPKQPDFKVFALDGGEGKPVSYRPKARLENTPDKYAVKPPAPEEPDDQPVEDDEATPEWKEAPDEEDDCPF